MIWSTTLSRRALFVLALSAVSHGFIQHGSPLSTSTRREMITKPLGSKYIHEDVPYPRDPPVEGSKLVGFNYLTEFMKDVFVEYGVPENEAEVAADVLIESDKRGIDSHGIGRLKPIYCDRWDANIMYPTSEITVEAETDATALLNGNLGLGLYIGPYAMNMAIEKAKKHGVGFVAVKNSTHYGIAGYYTTMATDAGMVGFTGTNARPSIAPTFGVEPMLGTNPVTFGIPTDEPFPFVIDCATSVNQRGKIERYQREGKPTPPGQVIDENGNIRTDTEGILKDLVKGTCALAPVGGTGDDMGGYKGFGWATTVELLSTAFQSGPWGEEITGVDKGTGEKKPMPLGHYFLAINIDPLIPLDDFKRNAGELLRGLRNSKKDPQGPGRIWTAGEPEHNEFLARSANNPPGFFIPPALQKDMVNLRAKYQNLLDKYSKFPFEE
uniref:Malate dehydrogenase n=1 Tax=Heterosigma akashiwo TaxID=2829 RepID=A0A7S3YEW5_HETAK